MELQERAIDVSSVWASWSSANLSWYHYETHYVAKTYCENSVKEAGIPFQSTLPISFSIKTAIYTQIPWISDLSVLTNQHSYRWREK